MENQLNNGLLGFIVEEFSSKKLKESLQYHVWDCKQSLSLNTMIDKLIEISQPKILAQISNQPAVAINQKGKVTNMSSPAMAVKCYLDGGTIYFKHLQKVHPLFFQLQVEYAEILGVPKEEIEVQIFANKKGSGTPIHADYDINFNLGISGNKRWRITDKDNLVDPPQIVLPDPICNTIPLLKKCIGDRPMLDSMPQNSDTVYQKRGTAIFLPRGIWHDTYCKEDCLSILFAWRGIMVIDKVLDNLRQSIICQKEFRKFFNSKSTDVGNLKVSDELGANISKLLREHLKI